MPYESIPKDDRERVALSPAAHMKKCSISYLAGVVGQDVIPLLLTVIQAVSASLHLLENAASLRVGVRQGAKARIEVIHVKGVRHPVEHLTGPRATLEGRARSFGKTSSQMQQASRMIEAMLLELRGGCGAE
jgi:hypothetical protein